MVTRAARSSKPILASAVSLSLVLCGPLQAAAGGLAARAPAAGQASPVAAVPLQVAAPLAGAALVQTNLTGLRLGPALPGLQAPAPAATFKVSVQPALPATVFPAGLGLPHSSVSGVSTPRRVGVGVALTAAPAGSPVSASARTASEAAPAVPKRVASRGQAVMRRTGKDGAASEAARAEGRARVSAAVRVMSGLAAEAMEAAGPVSRASAGDARSLGRRLAEILRMEANPKAASGTEVPPEAPPSAPGAASEQRELNRRKMVQTLEYVASIFSEHYAPLEFKRGRFKLDLKAQLEKARAEILAAPDITTQRFQQVMAAFVAGLKDHHSGIHFHSTLAARLPVSIVGAGGKYYIADIDRRALPEKDFPFQAGDEVVEFDGRPINKVIAELVRANNTGSGATDKALAEMRLTRRSRAAGAAVPKGEVALKVRTQAGEAVYKLQWRRAEELIPDDVPVRDEGGLLHGSDPFGPIDRWLPGPAAPKGVFAQARAALKKLIPLFISPAAELLSRFKGDNPRELGGRDSFVPALGKVLWEAPPQFPLKAYVYENEAGRKLGYIRVPSYMGDAMTAELFGKLVTAFEAKTDGLVLDQVNNPGGNLFFMYALLSRLTDKPLVVPTQRAIIGEEDAVQALQLLQAASQITDIEEVKQALGESLAGYAVTMKLWEGIVANARFTLDELKAGRRLTDLFPMMGIEVIEPHKTQRYTKPIVVLINELDFSCADFLPAVLQDNKRAVLFGVRTAGAGGAVRALEFPNQFGIAGLSYTWSIAMRPGGKPIENAGVRPDVPYRPTPEDLKGGYAGYRKALNEAVGRLLPPAPAPKAEPGQGSPAAEKTAAADAPKPEPAQPGPSDRGPAAPEPPAPATGR